MVDEESKSAAGTEEDTEARKAGRDDGEEEDELELDVRAETE